MEGLLPTERPIDVYFYIFALRRGVDGADSLPPPTRYGAIKCDLCSVECEWSAARDIFLGFIVTNPVHHIKWPPNMAVQ